MEENQPQSGLLEKIENAVMRRRRAPALRRAAARLVAAQKAVMPGGRGFVTGYTVCAQLQLKSVVLLFCSGMLVLFSAVAQRVWVLYGAAFCLLAAAAVWGISLLRRSKAPMVLFDDAAVCLLNAAGKLQKRIPYPEIREVHVLEDQLALCTAEHTWVLTAGEGENLSQIQDFMEVLGRKCAGRTFFAEADEA